MKKIIWTALCIAALGTAFALPASAIEINPSFFKGNTSEVLEIPDNENGLEITQLATAYGSCEFPEVKKIKLPKTVKCFRGDFEQDFFDAFPNLEEIEADSEYFVSVDGVLFSADMTEMIKYPPNKAGESYTIPESVKCLNEPVFKNSRYLKHIKLPDSLEGRLVATFEGAKQLEELVIPEGVTELNDVIYECESLKSITIPSTVNLMRCGEVYMKFMFDSCPSLENIYVNDGNEIYKSIDGILYDNHDKCIVPMAKPLTATPTGSKIIVNGEEVKCEAYNVMGNNYFKLRDVAMLLSGTEVQFDVTWDDETKTVSILIDTPYTPVGGECELGDMTVKTAYGSNAYIEAAFPFNIAGNNYFRIRDLGRLFDFAVDWDEANNTVVIDTTKRAQ
ncbi:MAG: leucine-rich repeat protein [Clostridiales bacterium]|nr:leucine-rich repeat protein [Clostridiales bacterium]